MFRKKKGMIDVGELARQGRITPVGAKTIEEDANRDGFVELGGSSNSTPSSVSATSSTMNFFDSPASAPAVSNSNLAERITALSSKISKIEQRLEVIERKLGVGDSAPPVMW